MVSPSTTSVLRKITAWAVLPAFPMLLSSGIVFAGIIAAVGIVPLGFSLIACLAWHYKRAGDDDGEEDKRKQLRKLIWALVDAAIACCYVGPLVAFWITEPHRGNSSYGYGYCYNSSGALGPTGLMLETYGSCFLILNMAIHAFLVATNFPRIAFKFSRECPTCAAARRPETTMTGGKGPKYSLLGEYRDSMESSEPELESARQSIDV